MEKERVLVTFQVTIPVKNLERETVLEAFFKLKKRLSLFRSWVVTSEKEI